MSTLCLESDHFDANDGDSPDQGINSNYDEAYRNTHKGFDPSLKLVVLANGFLISFILNEKHDSNNIVNVLWLSVFFAEALIKTYTLLQLCQILIKFSPLQVVFFRLINIIYLIMNIIYLLTYNQRRIFIVCARYLILNTDESLEK